MTYSPKPVEDELGISQEIDLFIKHIDSIKYVLPVMVMVVQQTAKRTWDELKAFEDDNCEIEEDEDMRKVSVPYGALRQWRKKVRRHEDFHLASKLLPRSLIVSLVSQYDAYLGRLLRKVFIGKPDILNSSDRKLSFEDISSLGSIENARDLILEKEVESILRSSHADQFKWMENTFGLTLTKDLKIWPIFIELTERRNLFVHTDGVVSAQYLSTCAKHKCTLAAGLEEGTALFVSAEYFRQSHQCIFEIGTKLGHVLWRKLFPEQRQMADSNLIGLTYDLIDRRRYSLAICFLDFAFEGIKKFSDEASKLYLLINRAQAYKWSNDEKRCKQILAEVDWSAKSDNFKLAHAVLSDSFLDAQQIMKRIGKGGSITSEAYRDWPLFKTFRESNEFLEMYSEIFGEDFKLSAKTMAVEALEDESIEPIVNDDLDLNQLENTEVSAL
jgi:hypothetical protein